MTSMLTWRIQIYGHISAIILDCPEDVLLNRLLERGQSSNRIDDNMASIKMRLKTYKEESSLVESYMQKKWIVKTVRYNV